MESVLTGYFLTYWLFSGVLVLDLINKLTSHTSNVKIKFILKLAEFCYFCI